VGKEHELHAGDWDLPWDNGNEYGFPVGSVMILVNICQIVDIPHMQSISKLVESRIINHVIMTIQHHRATYWKSESILHGSQILASTNPQTLIY
jgi:hypothetical protein